MRKTYPRTQNKSKQKFEIVGDRQLAVHLPLPLVEVWEELQPEVEHRTGLAGRKIIRAVIEDEVTRRVGPRHRPETESNCVRGGQQPGYVVFGGQKVAVERPRVRTREDQEVPLDSYARRPAVARGRRAGSARRGLTAC